MNNDKVRAAKRAAGLLTPKSGWGDLSEATFSTQVLERLAAIAKKAGAQPEAIGELLKAAQFAVIRAYIGDNSELPPEAKKKLKAFLAAARDASRAWRDLGPSLTGAIIEHAKPLALTHDFGELNAAIFGAVFVEHTLKESGAHRPKEYALCDALCAAWVKADLRPGFSDDRDLLGKKPLGLFEQFAETAAGAIGTKIGPRVFRDTIERHKARLPTVPKEPRK